ncbi:hypothetical protein [Streptomyces sp. WMMC940]|uniref:hypothetical protein n=1 Tax=Streptomyces sp. WMMC940 TaxID=3015153 RepID=UPI0022B72165|nr:hypothetical protein [Streptomyces sp. WMMC940]MCZ7459030.1 hypothetical protein [Streptomyces sp. WMMC940]
MCDGPPRLEPPTAPASVRRRTVWHRAWGACTALLGFGVTLLAGAVLLGVVPELLDDERAFAAASPCPAAAGVVEGCLRDVTATVVSTVIKEAARYDEFSVTLRGPREVSGDVDMGAPGPLLEDLRPGDVVTVTRWRDYSVAVAKDGRSQQTADTPVGEPQLATAVGSALLSAGVFTAYAGGRVLTRARRYGERGLPRLLVVHGKAAFGAMLCAVPAMIVGGLTGVPLQTAVWLVLLPVVWWFVRRRELRGRGRHAAPALRDR